MSIKNPERYTEGEDKVTFQTKYSVYLKLKVQDQDSLYLSKERP